MKFLLNVLFFIAFSFAGSAQTKIVCPAPGLSNNSTNPLLIVDSTVVDFANIRYLSPKNIDQFKILKDAKATALYGSRAAHGVIILDMKKNFRFLNLDDILRAHKADSVIGKSMIVTINDSPINNIKALKVDASIIQSVHIAEMMNAGTLPGYSVTINIKPIAIRSSKEDGESPHSIMIRGDKTSI